MIIMTIKTVDMINENGNMTSKRWPVRKVSSNISPITSRRSDKTIK